MKTPFSTAPLPSTAADSAEPLYRRAFETCLSKAAMNVPRLVTSQRSGAFHAEGDYFAFPEGFFDIGNWTSSFFTGMALLSIELHGERDLLKQVNRLANLYREKATTRSMDTMHDLGFLYSLYSVGLYKLTGSLDHRASALRAADELAKRFVPRGGYIRAWGRMDDHSGEYAGLAIIDCMMNLPLLFWASEETGNRFHHQVAVDHADTTLRCFVRADSSVCHAFRFDQTTGNPSRPDNYCGHDVDTHWARGTAWAIYGFALAHRYTGDVRYLDASRGIARRFVALLDDAIVPPWDFRLPPDMPPLRDTSAAAVAVCGIQELLERGGHDPALQAASDRMLGCLCDRYVNHDPACLGVLREGQVGDGQVAPTARYRARNAYTSWGDYFLTEALARRLHGLRSYW